MKAVVKNVKGAALVEYGLLVGLIAIVVLVAVRTLGTEVDGVFDTVGSALSGANASAQAAL